MGKTFKRNDKFKNYRKDTGFKKSHKFKEILKGNKGHSHGPSIPLEQDISYDAPTDRL